MRRPLRSSVSFLNILFASVVAACFDLPVAPRPTPVTMTTSAPADEEEAPPLPPPAGTLGCDAFGDRSSAAVDRVEDDLVWIKVRYEGVPISARYMVRFWPFGRHVPPVHEWDAGRLEAGGDYVEVLGPFRVPVAAPTELHYNIDFEAVGEDERGPLLVQCDRGGTGEVHPPRAPAPPSNPPNSGPPVPPPAGCESSAPPAAVIAGGGSWRTEKRDYSSGTLYRAMVSASFQLSGGGFAGEARIVWTNGSATKVKTRVPIARACGAATTCGSLSWESDAVPASHGHVNCGARYEFVIDDGAGRQAFAVTLSRVGACP